ncbi:hypothetical protein CEXT_648361 [Caerostris extrusa]|uniref:Uncharacterized protein n=1 Tax=Caerostris extrusa TaxID=172846 RepID=A0AAV4TPB1_CAEEX|nr:hypothetical protein CEXT_648361 [Caerostris extrusa]
MDIFYAEGNWGTLKKVEGSTRRTWQGYFLTVSHQQTSIPRKLETRVHSFLISNGISPSLTFEYLGISGISRSFIHVWLFTGVIECPHVFPSLSQTSYFTWLLQSVRCFPCIGFAVARNANSMLKINETFT